MERSKTRRPLAGVAAATLLTALAAAQPAIPEAPRVHALTGVRVVLAPGHRIEGATVVMRDGVLTAVGAEAEIPADARVWEYGDAEVTVYPGLIDPYTVLPWPLQKAEEESPPQDGHPNPLVRPEREMSRWAADPQQIGKLRGAGFTTAVVAPKEGVFRGCSALLNLGAGPSGDNLLRPRVAHNVSFATQRFGGGYPTSVMGAIALIRQTLLDAGWFARARVAYASHPGQARPPFNRALEELAEAAAGREPVVFETEGVDNLLRAARLADELDLDAWLVGSGEEYRRLDAVRTAGRPILLPLAFPDPPAAEGEDLTVGLTELRHWDQAPDNPRKLLDAGLTVAFTSHRLDDPKAIHRNLARAVERGLDPAAALAALTTTPAELLGIADRAGTLEAGKMANLVVVEGELFREKPKILEVWIDGQRYETEGPETRKEEP